MRCRFSHLRNTCAPTRASSVREVATSVRCATDSRRRRASISRATIASWLGTAPPVAPALIAVMSSPGGSAPAQAGLGLAARIERFVDLGGLELGHLTGELAHGTALLE